MTIALFFGLGAFQNLAVWAVLRFILGMTINGMFVVSETWINQLVTVKNRGRVMVTPIYSKINFR